MKLRLAAAFLLICLSLPVLAQDKVTLTTEDKWKLSALYQTPENGKVVILLHDLGRRKEDFPTFSKKLKDAGFGYLSVDLRGHGQSTNLNVHSAFNKTGTDNEFNQMVRDVNAAIAFLNGKEIATHNIFILGAGLGANVAAKALILNPDVEGIVLLTPSLKTRDVLTMNGIKVFKNPVLIAVSSTDRKQFMEASFIRNAAYLSSGGGKVTFLTAYNLKGVDMLDRYLTSEVIQWLNTPRLPEVKPDAIDVDTDEPILLPSPSELPGVGLSPEEETLPLQG